jgi:hypothetical protein
VFVCESVCACLTNTRSLQLALLRAVPVLQSVGKEHAAEEQSENSLKNSLENSLYMSAQDPERASRSSNRPELVPLRLMGERAAAAAAAATAAVAMPCI